MNLYISTMLERLSSTDWIAGWGALAGTASLAWNVWTWRRDCARVDVAAKYHDAGGEPWISYKIRNRGSRPTTIEDVQLITIAEGVFGMFGLPEQTSYLGATHPETIAVPAALAPGGYWEGSSAVSQENRHLPQDIESAVKSRRLHCRVSFAHTPQRVRALVREEGILDFL
jgi:hypothetical protein